MTYANLLHNFKLMKEHCQTSNQTVEVSFLPHFSSLGLVSSYLHILYSGGQGYYMSTKTFLSTPGAWMQAVSKYRATHIKTPNFALEYLLLKWDNYDPRDLNLESVESILVCMEPANINTTRSFESTMSRFKLRKNIIQFGYGLAEHVALLSVSRIGDVPVINKDRVSCGKPLVGVDVKIVDPHTLSIVAEREVGEIWVASDSKAAGFWDDDKTSREIFHAKLKDSPEKEYLRTGDLGLLSNGRLFVCEKMSDTILIKGKMIYPTDIESIVGSVVPAVLPGKTLVFKSDSKEETLTVVVELSLFREYSQKLLKLFSYDMVLKLQTIFNAKTTLVAFVAPHTLPFASSKMRQLCKELIKNNELPVMFKWQEAKDCTAKVEIRRNPACPFMESANNSEVVQIHSPSLPPAPRRMTVSSKTKTTNTSPQFLTHNVDDDMEVELRRRSAPATNPPVHNPQLQISEHYPKAYSQSYVRRNSILKLSRSMSTFFGRMIEPDSNIWKSGFSATEVSNLSDHLTHEFGFAVKPEDLSKSQTPKCIYRLFQSSLLDTNRRTTGLSTDDGTTKLLSKKSHTKTTTDDQVVTVGAMLSNIYASKCDIPLEDMYEAIHSNEEIAVVGMGGTFAGKY